MSDGDWMMLSKRDEALWRSCTDNESIVLIGGQWTKLPKRIIGAMMLEALMHATEDALKKLGANYRLQTGTGENGLGHSLTFLDDTPFANMEHDHDILAETIAVTVTLTDGRVAQGFSKIRRLGPH